MFGVEDKFDPIQNLKNVDVLAAVVVAAAVVVVVAAAVAVDAAVAELVAESENPGLGRAWPR